MGGLLEFVLTCVCVWIITAETPAKSVGDAFEKLGVHPGVCANLTKELAITKPTEIQAAALPSLLKGNSVTFYAETGSGKTLCKACSFILLFLFPYFFFLLSSFFFPSSSFLLSSFFFLSSFLLLPFFFFFANLTLSSGYLLPVVSGVLRTKEASEGSNRFYLKALILEPSLELAIQVHSILQTLAKDLPLKIHMIGSGFGVELGRDVDILVSTPGSLKHFDLSSLFSNLEHVVLDEADVLLDGGNKRSIHDILSVINSLQQADKPPPQYIFSAATLPATALKSPLMFIQDHYPGIEKIKTTGVHRPVPTLKERFIELPGSQKLSMLLNLLNEGAGDKKKKTLIFVRTLEQAKKLGDFLESQKVEKSVLSKTETAASRVDLMHQYMDGNFTNLVCTDLASRGLDFPEVERVIQYDFALNAVDYLHRAGRTARNGRAGEVVSFVDLGDRDLARAIQKVETIDNLSTLFSRNRLFRNKIRKAAKKQ